MADHGSRRRDWTIWFQPRALEGSLEGVVFAGLCLFSLALIGFADVRSDPVASVGALEVIPVIAAGWLLSDRMLVLVSVWAILGRLAVVWLGGVDPITGAVEAGVVPFMAIVTRVAAVSVVAARASAGRAALVSRIARIASSAVSLDDVLDRVVEEMARDGLRGGTISLIDERNRLYIVASEGTIDETVRELRLGIGEGIMGRVAAEGKPLLVDDLDAPGAPSSPTRAIGTNAAIRSIVVVPLLSAGRVIGVLELDSDQPRRFAEGDVLLLEQVAVAVSGAVQRAGALRLADGHLQRRLHELSVLLDAARGLAASLDLDVLAGGVCRSVAEITRGGPHTHRRASVIRVDGGQATVLSDFDESGESLVGMTFPLLEKPGLAAAAATGELTSLSAEHLTGSVEGRLTPTGTRSAAYAPIRVGDSLWGILALATQEEHQFDASELRLLQGMADLAGLAIGNAELLRIEKSRSEQLREHGDRMAALDHAKSEFLRLASHELRGPLAVLRGYISMLADGSLGELPEQAMRVMDVMSAKVTEINVLIDQMLDTARLEDSRLQLTVERADLRPLVRTAAAAMKLLAGPRHTLNLELPAEPVLVEIDSPRVLTILTNLIDNAIKYSPAGGLVDVRLTAADGSARIAVSDHGLGIAVADLPRLFTRFGRLVTDENSHIPGTGLGLYLARELARMHGGDISVRTTAGKGSTFTVHLPLVEARSAASA